MTNDMAKEYRRPFLIVENDKTTKWMEEIFHADGTRELKMPANDTLYKYLETRYGGGFAQWVIDGLTKDKTK